MSSVTIHNTSKFHGRPVSFLIQEGGQNFVLSADENLSYELVRVTRRQPKLNPKTSEPVKDAHGAFVTIPIPETYMKKIPGPGQTRWTRCPAEYWQAIRAGRKQVFAIGAKVTDKDVLGRFPEGTELRKLEKVIVDSNTQIQVMDDLIKLLEDQNSRMKEELATTPARKAPPAKAG